MMTTTEKNKLIAEFMGWKERFFGMFYSPNKTWSKENELAFDSSWDWLMPVVEKIESLRFKVNIFGYNEDTQAHYVIVYSSKEGTISIQNQSKLPKIEAVYNACVEFINYYNQNNL